MIDTSAFDAAMAAYSAARQARIDAAAGRDHTPAPVTEDTARALIAATGHTANNIAVSSTSHGDTLAAIGRHVPEVFMAAVHAITDAHGSDDPFGLFESLYGEIFNGGVEFADMAGWGVEDVWHAHVVVVEHGWWNGEHGTPGAADCLCIDHTWAMREVPAGTGGAVEVTVWRDSDGFGSDDRRADASSPMRRHADGTGVRP